MDDDKKKENKIEDKICFIIPIIIILAIAFFVYNSYSAYQYDQECLLKINASIMEYNKTKPLSEKSDNIPIKGKIMIAYEIDSYPGMCSMRGESLDKFRSLNNLTESFSPNENITIFCEVNRKENAGGTVTTSDWKFSEGTATNYAWTTDIIVIYWPEMKIAGWNTIQGEYAKEGDIAVGGEAYGDDLVAEWIKSLQ